MGIIFSGLCITEDDDQEIEETVDELMWTVSRACGALLVEVAVLLKDQILAETIQFASGKLANPTDQAAWQDHYVGMVALGSVMEGPSVDAIQRELEPAYATVFALLGSSGSARVRFATAWLIMQIARHSPQLVFSKQENVRLLMEQGMSHIEQDHIQIKSFIATAWTCAFEAAAKMQNS